MLAAVAYYNIAEGILTGLLAAVFGLWDWSTIPSGTRAKGVGLAHGLGNVVVLVLLAISWWLRGSIPSHVPTTLAFILARAGLGTLTSWLGAELIYRLRVDVDDGAHLDSPTSLSGKPAALPGECR